MSTRIALVAAALAGVAGFAQAQPGQLGQPVQPSAMPAARKHAYDITAEAGAWCISVQTFVENFDSPNGRDFTRQELEQMFARSKARRLALDFVTVLRRDYQLPAYMFNRGDEERQKEEQRVAEQRRQRLELYRKLGMTDDRGGPEKFWNKRLYHLQDQYIVLIGGYPDPDTARRDLDRIRKLKAPPKEFMNVIQAALDVQDRRKDSAGGYMNPFVTAMVLPNPHGPKLKAQGADPEELAKALSAMNAKNKYNLLQHQGKWTLVVKSYRVPVSFVGTDGKNGGVQQAKGTDMSQVYENIAKAAEQLAGILRSPQFGGRFDAYAIHTHNSSMVTVGVFESEKDPRLFAMQAELSRLSFDMEQLMNPAMPIMVPRAK